MPKDCDRRPLESSPSPLYRLTCDLRTINSEFDSTNFSVIPAVGTAALAIQCADSVAAQSRLLDNSFAHLTFLQVRYRTGMHYGALYAVRITLYVQHGQ